MPGPAAEPTRLSGQTIRTATPLGPPAQAPGLCDAARPEQASAAFARFVCKLAARIGKPVPTGVFGADMKVALTNDGPVTIWLDSATL